MLGFQRGACGQAPSSLRHARSGLTQRPCATGHKGITPRRAAHNPGCNQTSEELGVAVAVDDAAPPTLRWHER
jgi:hypothetical protein